jgi:predicted Zn-dependent protease
VSSVLEPQQLATIMTHMIGHNLGLKHDEDGKCHMIRITHVKYLILESNQKCANGPVLTMSTSPSAQDQ